MKLKLNILGDRKLIPVWDTLQGKVVDGVDEKTVGAKVERMVWDWVEDEVETNVLLEAVVKTKSKVYQKKQI